MKHELYLRAMLPPTKKTSLVLLLFYLALNFLRLEKFETISDSSPVCFISAINGKKEEKMFLWQFKISLDRNPPSP